MPKSCGVCCWQCYAGRRGQGGQGAPRRLSGHHLSFPVYEGYGNHDALGTLVPNSIKARNASRTGVSNISTNGFHYSWDWDFLHVVCLNVFRGHVGTSGHCLLPRQGAIALNRLDHFMARR